MSVDFKDVGKTEEHRSFVITLEDGTVIDVLYHIETGNVSATNHGRKKGNAEEKFNSLPIGSEIVFIEMPGNYRVVELNVHAPVTRGVMGQDYRIMMIYEMCHVHAPWESQFRVLNDIEKGISIDKQWTAKEILDREA